MSPLPHLLKGSPDKMDAVPECITPVYIHAETHLGKMSFYFEIPPQSPTVREFATILAEGLQGSTPEQVFQVSDDFYQDMGLHLVLTHQRLNGLSAILAHIKKLAIEEINNDTYG